MSNISEKLSCKNSQRVKAKSYSIVSKNFIVDVCHDPKYTSCGFWFLETYELIHQHATERAFLFCSFKKKKKKKKEETGAKMNK